MQTQQQRQQLWLVARAKLIGGKTLPWQSPTPLKFLFPTGCYKDYKKIFLYTILYSSYIKLRVGKGSPKTLRTTLHIMRRIFCMLRNTRSKVMNIYTFQLG
jgi:hypothetical protein